MPSISFICMLEHHDCLYIPSKMGRQTICFLLDTRNTDNVLSKTYFNALPGTVKEQLTWTDSSARMADRNSLIIYGTITLMCRVWLMAVEVTFKVANILDYAILGMRFFNQNGCFLFVAQGLLEENGQLLACVDREGNYTFSKIQVLQTITLPGQHI